MAAIIVAVDENNGIGFNGDLLEHIPEDMKMFQKLTIDGGYVMMGRKTYESLPKKPLPHRYNYVITKNPEELKSTDPVKYIDLSTAKHLIEVADNLFINDTLKLFVIGGGSIYKELLPYCNEIYMTKILKTHNNVDTYFPALDTNNWQRTMTAHGTYKDIEYQFWYYRRK